METSPKMLGHIGEMVTVTSEVLPTGSGHNHWNSLELGSMHIKMAPGVKGQQPQVWMWLDTK